MKEKEWMDIIKELNAEWNERRMLPSDMIVLILLGIEMYYDGINYKNIRKKYDKYDKKGEKI